MFPTWHGWVATCPAPRCVDDEEKGSVRSQTFKSETNGHELTGVAEHVDQSRVDGEDRLNVNSLNPGQIVMKDSD